MVTFQHLTSINDDVKKPYKLLKIGREKRRMTVENRSEK